MAVLAGVLVLRGLLNVLTCAIKAAAQNGRGCSTALAAATELHVYSLDRVLHVGVAERNVANVAGDAANREAKPGGVDVLDQDVLRPIFDAERVLRARARCAP